MHAPVTRPEDYPIILSVVGQSLATPGILRTMTDLMRGLHEACHGALRVMTATNTPTSELAIRLARQLKIPFIVVVEAGMVGDPDDPSQVDALQVVPFMRPAASSVPFDPKAGEEALRDILLQSAHIILSVGSDGPSERDAAAIFHKSLGSPLAPMMATSPFQACRTLRVEAGLDSGTTIPWLQVIGEDLDPDCTDAVSACVMLDLRKPTSVVYLTDVRKPFDSLPEDTKTALKAIRGLNAALRSMTLLDQRNFWDQYGYLSAKGVPDPAGHARTLLAYLRCMQSGVDAVARGYQRWLLGVGVPAVNLADWYRQAKGNWMNGGWFLSVNTLLIFCLLVPSIVLLFEVYAHTPHFLHMENSNHYLLLIYVITAVRSITE